MEDNYLWDRSGEADPEIQELEETLGELRYQSRPLDIPRNLQLGRRRRFFRAMAIAAAIALCAVLLGVWFSFNRRQPSASVASHSLPIAQPAATATQPSLKPNSQVEEATVVNRPKQIDLQKHREARRDLLARNQSRATRTVIRQPKLTSEELAEKEQVLVALRLVSYKLNVAQRKTQGVPQLNTIRNQHKIG
ncbi:MAG: hypothetical protein QOH70_454 [Blastocatellia bacterium]|jgi:hypothetical protein|nr:hypothetical protein [Blastocatellia bacterium]